jgi:hypothetical protein
MSQPKLTLNLNEQNELAFKLSIEGSSEDVDSTQPNIRFLVRENGRDTGWMYGAKKGDDGFVVVNINDSGLFSEDKTYTGKLEVILGNHYFVPTEVELEFIQPLKVEAAVVTANRSKINEAEEITEKPLGVIANTVQVRNNRNKIEEAPKPKRKPRPRRNKKRKWEDLSEAEQHRVKKALLKKRRSELREAKKAEQRRQRAEAAKKAKKEELLKESLKNLMSDSLLED